MRKLILAGLATLTLTTVAAVSVNKPTVKYQNEYKNYTLMGVLNYHISFLKNRMSLNMNSLKTMRNYMIQ